ncbi:NAD(P)/FAD-dependent oxidoreductase [Saccharopolyspora rectivirgula]|jgi:NADH dehydrogenase|nr:FAD-dependent oxidoreductase [Saccharopolyspora rectivirgula]
MSHRIVVLGAGYAGLSAAKRLSALTDAQIVLVNQREEFVHRVRLHQIATGQRLPSPPLRQLLRGTRVQLKIGLVTGIDPENQLVHLGEAAPLHYDTLLYALGSRTGATAAPGVAEHAHTVAELDGALRLREAVEQADTVAVVGGGLTGAETATELAESFPQVKTALFTAGPIGEGLSERGREHVHEVLTRLGVDVHDNTEVTEVGADGLTVPGGHHPADLVVWSAGFQPPPLAAEAGFTTDRHGRIVVDTTLRSVSHPQVYAVGDAAAIPGPGGRDLRMACATAMPSALAAARAIADRLAGRPARPLRFRYVVQCISLGRREGLVQFVNPDDSPQDRVLRGKAAIAVKEAILSGVSAALRRPLLAELSTKAYPRVAERVG